MQAHPSRVTFSRLTRTLASGLASAAAFGWMLLAPAAQAQDALAARVDKVFAAWDKPDSPGASVAVVRDGRVIYSRGYGQAQLEYAVPNTPATTFHAASVSKQFTAFAIQLLVQEGKLSLDDEVRKHVPELQLQGPPVTIRQLVHHTSGVRDQWSLVLLAGLRMDDVITEPDILGLLWAQRQTNFVPGDEELYSNSGYTLLGLIVRRVSGQSLAAFAKARIFDPLGMSSTRFQENYGDLVKGRAYSYYRFRDAWRYSALSYSNTGATSLFTTVEDLARWDDNLTTGRVGGAAVQAAMLVRGKLNNGREIGYASGLVLGNHRGLPVQEHSGSDAGFRSHLLRLPAQKLSVLLLGNAADLATGQLARQVADIYLEGTPGLEPVRALPPEVELQARDLAPYLGDFEMRPGFVLTFTAERNQLMVQATGQPRFAMLAAAEDRFVVRNFEASVTFPRPVGNQPVETAMWQQGGRDLPLRRVVRQEPTAESLQACAGDYYSPELRTLYGLGVRNGKLFVRYPRGELELRPLAGDQFSAPFPLGVLAMRRNAAGACEGFAVTTGRVRNLLFQRVRLVTGP
jgi:CubicO group peptidase (beta-lactamase class C family)